MECIWGEKLEKYLRKANHSKMKSNKHKSDLFNS